MVERMHRQLKAALKARLKSPAWMDELPLVLLGIRTAWREGLGCAPADPVYGEALHVPGELLTPSRHVVDTPTAPFVDQLRAYMRTVQPQLPTFHGQQPLHQPPALGNADFVYVHVDRPRTPYIFINTTPVLANKQHNKF
jgi:hypothetical protein